MPKKKLELTFSVKCKPYVTIKHFRSLTHVEMFLLNIFIYKIRYFEDPSTKISLKLNVVYSFLKDYYH